MNTEAVTILLVEDDKVDVIEAISMIEHYWKIVKFPAV
jgi:hypothetical protein